MKLEQDNSKMRVLIIGSGPIVIGQSAEFDYAGTQACSVLKQYKIYTVLLNSNPATIQTDSSNADRIYIEPINLKNAKQIIAKEKITHIIGSMGGQTALNLTLQLFECGFLEEMGVKVLGSPPEAIKQAEDRNLFHKKMLDMGIGIPWSVSIDRENWKVQIKSVPSFPAIMRTSFTLGGLSGKILLNMDEAVEAVEFVFNSKDIESVELEQSLEGLTEMEYEVIRDHSGNSIMVCNMENLDPMGVHTGESIVVTPSLTIPDYIHQKMRKSALEIASSIGIVGACNVQFAVDEKRENYYVIEVNPRTSRSSALASKASGYPIAKIATMILLGLNLPEIRNPITENSSAAFEPSMDYVIVKIPLWPSDKFKDSGTIGVSMKSTGEVMGIGRSFEEAFLKAVVGTELNLRNYFSQSGNPSFLRKNISTPNWKRVWYIVQSIFSDIGEEEISQLTKWELGIVCRISNLLKNAKILSANLQTNLNELKALGIPDRVISWISGTTEVELLKMRKEKNILPSPRIIDSSSAEFRTFTRYTYSTYDEENDLDSSFENSVLIIGSGPNRIGQGLEFDYSSVKAIEALKEMGYRTIMINSNPETVSTDFNISDELFFDPITLEFVSGIIDIRKPKKIILQFSGQTGQNMANEIAAVYGEDIVAGTKPSRLEEIENRKKFSITLDSMGIVQAPWLNVTNRSELIKASEKYNHNVILRGSYVIGGASMFIIRSQDELDALLANSELQTQFYPVLVSEYFENAREFDLDMVSNGTDIAIVGIMEQIEMAGTHSGDSLALMGPDIPDETERRGMMSIALKFCRHYNLVGFSNIQFMIKNGEISVIELNARASRTIPVLSKWAGLNWTMYGIEAIMSGKLNASSFEAKKYGAKIPVFPFNRFLDSGFIMSPQMHSTGEAMVTAETVQELKQKIIETLNLFGKEILIFEEHLATLVKEGIREPIHESDAINLIEKGENLIIVCSVQAKNREKISKIALKRKIPFIPDIELGTFLDFVKN